MALGILDLSIVTDALIDLLNTAKTASLIWGSPAAGPPFDINVTGEPADMLPSGTGCQLTVYLFHVTADRYQRNSPVTGPYSSAPKQEARVRHIPYQPLSLDLYYMLTAHSTGAYIQEQQAMSMALKCFYENPFVEVGGGGGELCLTMDVENLDEISRLWQAIASPLRLCTFYKVSVVFIQPPDPPTLAPPVTRIKLHAPPVTPDIPTVSGTFAHITFVAPGAAPPATVSEAYDISPGIVANGQRILIAGTGLTGLSVFLQPVTGAEIPISSWIVPPRPGDTNITLMPSGAIPAPGVYTLTVGTGAVRYNGVPINVVPLVTPPANPILTPAGGPYTISGQGFDPTTTEVLLGAIALNRVTVAPAAGQFQVTGNSITFLPPTSLPVGQYSVRVLVNQMEALPAAWIMQ